MKQTTLTLLALLYFAFIISCNSTIKQSEITQQELKDHIAFLASDSLKGRYPGTPEDKIAAIYIAEQFQSMGLGLLFDNGLQAFQVQTKLQLGNNNQLIINENPFEVNTHFVPLPYSASTNLNAEVVFAGYGFNVKRGNVIWNNFNNIDVKNKWVLMLRGEPDIKNTSLPFAMYSSLRTKALTAKDLGAKGVIFVSGVNFDSDDELYKLGKPEGKIDIPIIQVKRDIANILLSESGKLIEEIEEKINKNATPVSFPLNTLLSCTTDISTGEETTFNVAAQLVSNPESHDYIVIGAHYDHLGFGGIGTGSRAPYEHKPHYGADDNASGVSSVIEIAEKLFEKKDILKNNFLFIAFGAEEMGLLGSKYFAKNLPIPDSLIKAMINIDMIGRMKPDSSLQIGGVGTSLESENLLTKLNANHNLKLGFSYEGYGPSDHSSFYSIDIPVFFISTGAHTDYHTPGDSLGNINFDGLLTASNYIYDLAYELALNDVHLTFQEAGPKSLGSTSKRNFKVSLGIMPDFSNVEKRGLRADIVIKDKAAYKAGMKDGDVIIAIDGHSVGDVYEYMERLTKLKTGQIITVEILRNDKKEVLIVQL